MPIAEKLAALFGSHQARATLEQLIADAKSRDALTDVDEDIVSANFKETGVGGQLEELTAERLSLSGYFSAEEVLEAMDRLGYRPATAYEGIYYASNGWGRKTTVAFLGSVWRLSRHPRSRRFVVELWYNGVDRELRLRDFVNDTYGDACRFLGVQLAMHN